MKITLKVEGSGRDFEWVDSPASTLPSETIPVLLRTLRDYENMIAVRYPGEYAEFKEGWE